MATIENFIQYCTVLFALVCCRYGRCLSETFLQNPHYLRCKLRLIIYSFIILTQYLLYFMAGDIKHTIHKAINVPQN